MIYPQTILTVADNTGAKKVMCIRILGGNKKYAEIGDTIIAVVKEALPNMPIKRSDVIRAIVVRTKTAWPQSQQCLLVDALAAGALARTVELFDFRFAASGSAIAL